MTKQVRGRRRRIVLKLGLGVVTTPKGWAACIVREDVAAALWALQLGQITIGEWLLLAGRWGLSIEGRQS